MKREKGGVGYDDLEKTWKKRAKEQPKTSRYRERVTTGSSQ